MRSPEAHFPITEPVYVAGHRGMVGSAVLRRLDSAGIATVVRTSAELDLRDRPAVFEFFGRERPRTVVLAAARVGGIQANFTSPVEFLTDNLQIQVNVIDAAIAHGVERLLFLGSSCIYPKLAPQPIPESALLTGPLEPTNEHYAIAKIAGIKHVQAARRELGLPYISAMPTNLYGPGDNYSLESSHVLPAMIRKFHDAAAGVADEVVLWGSGTPRREFLHVDDLAAAVEFLLRHYDDEVAINVGTGVDVTIKELASTIAAVAGYDGRVRWDSSKPDGTPRKLLDVSRINALGWQAGIDLEAGIRDAYAWFIANMDHARL